MARRESAPEPNELAGFGFGSITTCAGMSRGLYSLNDLPHLRVRNILVLPKQIACSCTGIGVLWGIGALWKPQPISTKPSPVRLVVPKNTSVADGSA